MSLSGLHHISGVPLMAYNGHSLFKLDKSFADWGGQLPTVMGLYGEVYDKLNFLRCQLSSTADSLVVFTGGCRQNRIMDKCTLWAPRDF